MKRTLMFSLLILAVALIGGCSSASAQCVGGNCSRGWGVWSPWVGGYYWQSPCAGGKCSVKKTEEPKAAEPAEPIPADEAPHLVEFKPFCVRVAELVNERRKAAGLPAFELDESLCSGCDRHSAWMASGGGFQHAYYAGARECIAMGVRTPEAVVNMWLGSSGHRAIILGSGRILGVGCSGSFWTLRVR